MSTMQNISLEQIRFSATAAQELRREMLVDADLAELATSIQTAGVLQPILVRQLLNNPAPDDRFVFECVAGERRVRAARLAGLEEIPATIRELTDEQVVELQLIENLQRQDLHELAEAEGYEQLLGLGHDVDSIAIKVGKSRGTVYARMKLLALTPAARKAFYQGKIAASVALLLARIPVPHLQDQALKEVSVEHRRVDDTGDRDGPEYRDQMSVRAATAHIQANYMLRLSLAGFKTSDATLVPSAGACGACPKRTGNQPELFGDIKGADVCTDPVCFKQKIAAHGERAIAAAKETGQTVLIGAEAKKVAKYGVGSHHLEGYIKLDSNDYSGSKTRTYRQLLGKAYVPTLLQDPETGKMIELASDKDVAKAKGSKPATVTDYSAQHRAADRKHRQAIAYRMALFKAVREASPKRKQLSREELELVADQIYGCLDHDSRKRLMTACGHDIKIKRKGSYGQDTDWPVSVKQMTDDELVQMARDCVLAHELQEWQHSGPSAPKDLEAAAKRFGVNAGAIKREIEEAAAAKVAKKKAGARKAKAKK